MPCLRRRALLSALALAAACGGTDPVAPARPVPQTVVSLVIGVDETPSGASDRWTPLIGLQYAARASLLPFTDPMPLVARGLTSPDYEVVPLAVQPTYVSSDTTVMRVEAGHLVIVGYGSAALMAFMPTTAPTGAGMESSITVTVTR